VPSNNGFQQTPLRCAMDEDVLGPAELLCHPDVELALERILALAKYGQMLGPTDFSNQWLEFFVPMIGKVELPHIPQVLRGESLHTREFLLEITG
jgi:hypothetical protein